MIKIDFFHGVQGVASSNLVIPTTIKSPHESVGFFMPQQVQAMLEGAGGA
jgi:hypothetical protein